MYRWFSNSSEHAETSTILSMMAGADMVFVGFREHKRASALPMAIAVAVYAAGEEMLNRLMTSQYPSAHDRHSRT